MSDSPVRWHLWYDDYEAGTAFITEGSYQDEAEPKVIAEGLPYDEAQRMVLMHNEGLPVPEYYRYMAKVEKEK